MAQPAKEADRSEENQTNHSEVGEFIANIFPSSLQMVGPMPHQNSRLPFFFLISFTFFNDSFFSRLKPSWSSRNCLDLCAQLCDLAHQLHIPLLRSLGPQNQNAMSVTIGYPIM